MRIISQNGEIDVPYEMSAIRNDDKKIILCMAGETRKGSVIATYSTSEKAQKAIEMLRTAYIGKPMMYKAKDIADAYKKATEMDLLMMFDSNIKNVFVAKANIFQFPQDEDVEV